MNDNGSIIEDGTHELYVYKVVCTYMSVCVYCLHTGRHSFLCVYIVCIQAGIHVCVYIVCIQAGIHVCVCILSAYRQAYMSVCILSAYILYSGYFMVEKPS